MRHDMLTPEQAAARFVVSEQTIRHWLGKLEQNPVPGLSASRCSIHSRRSSACVTASDFPSPERKARFSPSA
jgi:hypothetical protein